MIDFTYTTHKYHTHNNTHSTSTNHTNHTSKQQMHMSRQVGKADFATGTHRATQTCFYILPLIVKFVFAYNIFVLDVIRPTVNIGQYHSRPMRDVHGDKHVHIYARTHTYINIRVGFFFSGCGKRPITQKEADKLSWTQRGLNSQSSDRGNIVSCQLSSTFDSRHRDCTNKESPKGGDNPSEINMFMYDYLYIYPCMND